MWTRSENGEATRPAEVEKSRNHVILRKNFELVPATDETPEHWTYNEWQMTAEQYEVYAVMKAQNDALAGLITEII